MELSFNTWTHYLYVIHFVDGCYYAGVSKRKGDNPNSDRYWGSSKSKKHKEKWVTVHHWKEVIAYLWCNSHREAYEIEAVWQKLNFNLNDDLCLNERFGSTNFSESTQRQGGRTQGALNVINNTGFWREDLIKLRSKTGRLGGLKGGKIAVKTGQLAHAREKAWKATSKPVVLTNLLTGEKTSYSSLQAAARGIGGSASALCNVLKGHRNSHKGFSAEYL